MRRRGLFHFDTRKASGHHPNNNNTAAVSCSVRAVEIAKEKDDWSDGVINTSSNVLSLN